jgi:hypothetical protein
MPGIILEKFNAPSSPGIDANREMASKQRVSETSLESKKEIHFIISLPHPVFSLLGLLNWIASSNWMSKYGGYQQEPPGGGISTATRAGGNLDGAMKSMEGFVSVEQRKKPGKQSPRGISMMISVKDRS